jgi:hypothetical protein
MMHANMINQYFLEKANDHTAMAMSTKILGTVSRMWPCNSLMWQYVTYRTKPGQTTVSLQAALPIFCSQHLVQPRSITILTSSSHTCEPAHLAKPAIPACAPQTIPNTQSLTCDMNNVHFNLQGSGSSHRALTSRQRPPLPPKWRRGTPFFRRGRAHFACIDASTDLRGCWRKAMGFVDVSGVRVIRGKDARGGWVLVDMGSSDVGLKMLY